MQPLPAEETVGGGRGGCSRGNAQLAGAELGEGSGICRHEELRRTSAMPAYQRGFAVGGLELGMGSRANEIRIEREREGSGSVRS